jgi:hypothetical protein
MKKRNATPSASIRARKRAGSPPPNNWEREALARVARHVAEIDCYRPESRELGWESEAFERLRSLLKRL